MSRPFGWRAPPLTFGRRLTYRVKLLRSLAEIDAQKEAGVCKAPASQTTRSDAN